MVRVFKMVIITLLLLGMVFSLFYLREVERFDFSTYDPNTVLKSAEILTSKELMGRAVGEPGNELTVDYIEKFLKSKDIDYKVNWVSQLTPIIDGTSSMMIGESEFNLYKDFEFYISGRASDIDFNGEILYLGGSLYAVEPEIIKDRIVVVRLNRLSEKIVDYLIENEAKGILYCTYQKWFSAAIDRDFMNRKFIDIEGKISSEIFQGRITKEMSDVIYELATEDQYDEYFRPSHQTGSSKTPDQIVGVVPDVSIDVNVDYKLLELPNFIINFPGKNSDIANNFFSRFDGQGVGNEFAEYFPSAVNGAGSTASLLHLAEVLNTQKQMPEEDINIVLINGSQVSDKTFQDSLNWLSDKYAGNKNILFEYVGFEGSKGVFVDWDYYNNQSVIIGNKLFNYSGDLGVKFDFVDMPIRTFDGFSDYTQNDNPIVLVTGTHDGQVGKLNSSSDDNFKALSIESLDNATRLLLSYMNKDLYRNYPLNFIDIKVAYILAIIVFLGLMILYIREIYELKQGIILSKIYYSRAYSFLTVIYKYITSFGVAFILIGLILNIPSNFNLVQIGDSTLTNFSIYNMIKGTYFSFISIYQVISNPSSEISKKIVVYVLKSIKLIGWGLFISLSMGIIKGILDSYSKKQVTTLKTLTSIMVYSIPDVMIAIFSLLGIIYLSKVAWIDNLIGPTILRTTIMPIVALSVIPSIYISRLIFVAIEEEKQKEYVKFLYYQGIPRRQVYFRQFAKVSIMKVLQSMKSILMVIFSNLILVEHIFSVPGMMFNIITYKNNPYIVIVFALIIGIVFTLISGLSHFVLRIISPKKEVLS